MKRAFLDRLQKLGAGRWPVCDWRMILRERFDEGQPYLKACVGCISRSYSDLKSGVRYHVAWHDEQLLGQAMKEFRWEADKPITLTLADVQMWEIDHELISAELAQHLNSTEHVVVREAPASATVPATVSKVRPVPRPANDGRPIVRVTKDFKVLQMPDGSEVSLARKWKRRAFLHGVNEWCRANGKHDFHWQVIVEEYNAAALRTGITGKEIRTDRIDRDLFKKQLDLFAELFEPLDASGSLLRLRVDFQII